MIGSGVRRFVVPLSLLAIVALAAYLRFIGLDWDRDTHLNPDERFLTFVVDALRWPSSFGDYLNQARSTLNPRNVGYTSFVYGTFPTTLLKSVTLALHQTAYDQVTLLGRGLSAIFDLVSVVLVFSLARVLYRDSRAALLAAFLYATSTLAIQYAHFFVVDSFATTFILAATLCLARVQQGAGSRWSVLMGSVFGLALATKLSIFVFVVVVLLVGVTRVWGPDCGGKAGETRRFAREMRHLVLVGVSALLVFRLAQPDAFRGTWFLDLRPAARWLDDIRLARHLVGGDIDTPPGDQWTDRVPLVFPWINMVVWGMGLPLGLAAWIGWAAASWQLVRRRYMPHLIPVAWVATVFLQEGTQWVKSMRYFLPIYPMLAVLAGWGLVAIWDMLRASTEPRTWRRRLAPVPFLVVATGTLLWAASFASIYVRPNTRVTASRWMYTHIPAGRTLANTVWDDALPLSLQGEGVGRYHYIQMGWFDEDSPRKLSLALDALDHTDYIVLGSNRAYDSIARLPLRFPMTIRYFGALFDGSLGFRRVADFTSYPGLLGLSFPDQGAEEAFSVYDHPRVQLFAKTPAYSHAAAWRVLGAVDWSSIVRLSPKNATAAPTGLMLPEIRRIQDQHGGTWSTLFDRVGSAGSSPVALWALLIEALGLIAFPYLWLGARWLPDGGYAISKTFGLLLGGWAVWLLASTHMLVPARPAIATILGMLAVGALLLARSNRVSLGLLVGSRFSILLVEEGLFWVCFALFLCVHWLNPDLWHPGLGGEKPLDFSFLNAVVKSSSYPPYDPWFAGGQMNYYYFGFVLLAVPIKLTGIMPQVAYNLAIPTLFAMTASGAFAVGLALIHKGIGPLRRRDVTCGLLAALLVTGIGNLGEVRAVFDRNLTMETLGTIGHVRPDHLGWWYWNATRLIAHTPSEPGPITEFPFFTFLFGDLHAHAMALPLTLLSLTLTVAVARAGVLRQSAAVPVVADDAAPVAGSSGPTEFRTHRGGRVRAAGGMAAVRCAGTCACACAPLALTLGSLWPTNTWDSASYAAIALIGLVISRWHIRPDRPIAALRGGMLTWLAILLAGYLCFLPFHATYAPGYGSFELWTGSRTPLLDYLSIHGLFLFVLVPALLTDFWWGRGHNGVARSLRLFARYAPHRVRARRLLALHRRLVAPELSYWLASLLGFVSVACGLLFLVLRQPVSALVLLLLPCICLLACRRRPDPLLQLAWSCAGIGFGLTLFVEYFVLIGDLGRMNTVFKLYLQVWVLLGVSSAVGAALVYQHRRSWPRAVRRLWRGGFTTLLATSLLYPLLATPARVADRFDHAVGPTLDGAAFMGTAVYSIGPRRIDLRWDLKAMTWIQDNIPGSPVILEANTYPASYAWGERYAMFTGLPTVVGWLSHEGQQRAILPPEVLVDRLKDVTTAYTTGDPGAAHRILLRYHVDYVIVGDLERVFYPPQGLLKLAQQTPYWHLVYDNSRVQIYEVDP